MDRLYFLIRAGVYLTCLVVAWYAMSAVNYEKILKKDHVVQAQVLYFMLVVSLAYLCGSFILEIVYH